MNARNPLDSTRFTKACCRLYCQVHVLIKKGNRYLEDCYISILPRRSHFVECELVSHGNPKAKEYDSEKHLAYTDVRILLVRLNWQLRLLERAIRIRCLEFLNLSVMVHECPEVRLTSS